MVHRRCLRAGRTGRHRRNRRDRQGDTHRLSPWLLTVTVPRREARNRRGGVYCGVDDPIGGVDDEVLPGELVPPGVIEPLLIDPLLLDPERRERLCDVVEELPVPLVGEPLLIVSPPIEPLPIEPLGAVLPMPGEVLVEVPGVAPVPAEPGAPPVPVI